MCVWQSNKSFHEYIVSEINSEGLVGRKCLLKDVGGFAPFSIAYILNSCVLLFLGFCVAYLFHYLWSILSQSFIDLLCLSLRKQHKGKWIF